MKNHISLNYTLFIRARSIIHIGGITMNELLVNNIVDRLSKSANNVKLPNGLHSSFEITSKRNMSMDFSQFSESSREHATIDIVVKLLMKRYKNNIRIRKVKNGFYRTCKVHEFYDIDNGEYFISLDPFTFLKLKINNTDATMNDRSNYMYLREYIFNFYGIYHNFWNKVIFNEIEKCRIKYLRTNNGRVRITSISDNKHERSYLVDASMNLLLFDQKIELLNLIKKFLLSKEIYNKYHIPYKLGILLYGKPGTGKTTFAIALSKYLQMPIISVSANSISKEKLDFDNCIILIEELDLCCSNTILSDERIDNQSQTNESIIRSILLSIDSIEDGCIIIATTNHIERLDERIIRSGRFDIKVEMKDFTKENAIEFIKKYDEDPDEILKLVDFTNGINPADLQNILKQKKIKELGLHKED